MIHEKDHVNYHTFMFIQEGDLSHANEAKEWLVKLAKKYNLKPSKSMKFKKDLKTAFAEFLINKNGYAGKDSTLNYLYNSI